MKKRCIAWMLIVAMSINGMTVLAVEKAESKDNSVSAAYVKTAVHEDGWYHDNTSNSWYYYEDGEYVTDWKYVDGYWYYFNALGVMQKGWKKVDGYWYYFNQNGCMITGWKNVEGYWYYFNQNGCMITGWKNVDGYWYYFNQNGCMITGWKNVDGYWYYFNQKGCMITGWKNVDGYWYYFNQNGCMITGWKNVDGYWYYFNRAGVMQIGWENVDGYWYYFNRAGVMQIGWEKVDGYWYYFNRAGVMQTGWEKVDGYWYYFNKAGVMQTSRWIDGLYYVDASGRMLVNTYTPDGYWVGADGSFSIMNGKDREFVFCSGAGGWATLLDLDKNLNYKARYFSNSGEKYEKGYFTIEKQIDAYSYLIKINRYSNIYGLEDSKEFVLYLPGKKTSELTRECPQIWMWNGQQNYPNKHERSDMYILWNKAEELPFFEDYDF